MSIVRCQACSAPLQPAEGASQVRCTYCGATTKLGARRARHGGAGAQVTPQSASGATSVVIVLAAVAVVGVGAFVFLGDGAPVTFSEWMGKACPIDANGDETLDFVGRRGRPGSMKHELTFIDGATGDTIRSFGSEYAHENQLLCLGEDRFALTYPDFRLELWEASASEPATTVRLPDAISSWDRDGECLGLTIAGETHGVDLAAGKADGCTPAAASAHSVRWAPGRFDEDGAILEHAGTTYRVTAKSPGTPFLIVQAERDGQTAWETLLPIKGFDRVQLAASDDAVFTNGVKPGADDTGVLIALEASDGRVRFEQAQRPRWSTHYVTTFVYDGSHLVMTSGYGVHAYDGQTGELAWRFGGR